MRKFSELSPTGLVINAERFFAYIADDDISWDFVESVNDALPDDWQDPWSHQLQGRRLRQQVWSFWYNMPEKNRGWLVGHYTIPFEQIMAIDEDGDIAAQMPHIYLDRYTDRAWGMREIQRFRGELQETLIPDQKNRVSFFPKEFPGEEPEIVEV